MDDLIADFSAFFSMKLYAVKVILFYSSGIFHSIVTGGNSVLAVFSIIAMNVVDVAGFLNVFKQTGLQGIDRVPAYLGNFKPLAACKLTFLR